MSINSNKLSDDRYYITTNFYLACFLFAKGVELVNLNRSNPKRSEFIFRNNPEVVDLIDAFDYSPKDSPAITLDCRTFITAIKSLKDILHRERNQTEEG